MIFGSEQQQDEQKPINSYQELLEEVARLKSDPLVENNEPKGDPRKLLDQANHARLVIKNMMDKSSWPEWNTLFPNRRDGVFLPLDEVTLKALSLIEPSKYTVGETEQYINLFMDSVWPRKESNHGYSCKYDENQSFYYIRPLMDSLEAGSVASKLVDNVVKKPETDLSQEELKQVIEYESGIHKIHINIPIEKRALFMQDLLKMKMESFDSAYNRRMAAKPSKLSDQDIIDGGDVLSLFRSLKFSGFNPIRDQQQLDREGNIFPDLVIYINNTDPDQARILSEAICEKISGIARKYEDPKAEVPRYSSPFVASDGYHHSTLSITQGDSDFKNWLKGKGLLDQYFDGDSNYSRMK